MNIKTITAPILEPVTLADMKLYLKLDGTADDTSLTAILAAAREYGQKRQNRAYLTQTLELSLDDFPCSPFEFPYAPLQSVTSIKYTDQDGTETTFASSNYVVDAAGDPGRLALKNNVMWPTVIMQPVGGVKIRFIAGYTAASSVANTAKLAIMAFVVHRYENPGDSNVPQFINDLFDLDKVVVKL